MSLLPFSVSAVDRDSRARRGTILTPHGAVQTPAFMPVGTRATITGLDPADVAAMDGLERETEMAREEQDVAEQKVAEAHAVALAAANASGAA